MKKVMLMAGGTGGHIFPAIAIGQALQKKNIISIWLGSKDGMENKLVPQNGFELYTVDIKAFRGKSFMQQFILPLYFIKSVFQAVCILRKQRPDLVLGMGGFVAAPGAIAAKLLGIPVYIHEQNNMPGWTNKLLSLIAKKIFCGFPGAFKSSKKAIFTGNPVREDILNIPIKKALHTHPHILVLGGSRGAKIFNDVIPAGIKLLCQSLPHIHLEIYHQTGVHSTAHYHHDSQYNSNITVQTQVFIKNMAEIYDWADIIICRAGALTLAEITAVGLPAILIPYPYAAGDHQTVNTQYLVQNNAAVLLPQSDLTPQNLADKLINFLTPENYIRYAKASRLLRCETAVEKIITALN